MIMLYQSRGACLAYLDTNGVVVPSLAHVYRFIPLLLVLLVLWGVFYFDLYHYTTFATIKQYQATWFEWLRLHYVLSVLLFMLCYMVVVVLMIPAAAMLTMLGGYLFGFFYGAIYVLVAATMGSCCSFLMVQYALGSWLAEKHGTWVVRMQHGFQKNALSYLLFLRLVPLIPFPVVNVVPGILNIKKSTFFIGTFFGMMPGVCVYVMLGHGLGDAFTQGQAPDLSLALSPTIFFPLLALGLLSLLPLLYKYIKH